MELQVERENGVAIVKLNRPEKLNALNEPIKAALIEVFSSLASDNGVRAIVLTGNGRSFCSGGDVSTMGAFSAKSLEERLMVSQRLLLDIDAMDKPVIASVRGAVAGIGWSLALVCDQIVASDTAHFSQSFKNIGAVPDGGALQLLTQNIGVLRTKNLVLTGRRMPANEALTCGLVNRVVPDAELDESAMSFARELAEGPTLAYSIGKKLMRQLRAPSLENYMAAEMWGQTLAVLSEDHQEGARAFREKRKAVFKGI
ncbi:MAG: enoyl-CoA hydratase/isomerase family protein [Comamonadaceae bacterium]|nr:enoyl-CoA hydratase/isomerase family protein [Comamonadaceae bacterium]